jgi:hypothetical protein
MHVRARAAAATTHVRAGYRRCKFANRGKRCPFVPRSDSASPVCPELQSLCYLRHLAASKVVAGLFASTVTCFDPTIGPDVYGLGVGRPTMCRWKIVQRPEHLVTARPALLRMLTGIRHEFHTEINV